MYPIGCASSFRRAAPVEDKRRPSNVIVHRISLPIGLVRIGGGVQGLVVYIV